MNLLRFLMLPHISIKERSIQKITDVLIHKGFKENSEYFKVSNIKKASKRYSLQCREDHSTQVNG